MTTDPVPRQPASAVRKPPRLVTPDYLDRAAMHYLQRYSASVEQLRRVLTRKVRVSCRHHGKDTAEALVWVENTIRKAVASELVDDRRFSEGRVRTLRRKGHPAASILSKLRVKGVDDAVAAAALSADGSSDEDAARRWAERRRLGPWRIHERAERRDRDIAAMQRAGFNYRIARAVIDGEGT